MPFKNSHNPPVELDQPAREAIVDLLHFCLYADSHIALREGEFVADVVNVIGWETQSSFGSYEGRSVSNARAAKESAEAKREFLSQAASRLKTKDSRALAIALCEQLFAADGTTVAKESGLLTEIRAALKP